jgi:hypothetical protein
MKTNGPTARAFLSKLTLLAVGVTLTTPSSAWAAERPVSFEIAYLSEAPVIDGNIGGDEWSLAAALGGGVTRSAKDRYVAVHSPFTIWLGWDEEALYLAFRSAQPPEVPFSFGEGGSLDNVELAVLAYRGDDMRYPYRMFLTPDGVIPTDMAEFRARVERPPVITRVERRAGWTEGIETASRRYADPEQSLGDGTQLWDIEARIPRDTFAIDGPNAEGDGFRILISRTYSSGNNAHTPIVNRGIHGPGSGGIGYFFDPRGYTMARLVKDKPVVQFLDVLSLFSGRATEGMVFTNPGTTDAQLTVDVVVHPQVASQPPHEMHQTVSVPAGGRAALDAGARLAPPPQSGVLEIKVSGADGKALLDYRADWDAPARTEP